MSVSSTAHPRAPISRAPVPRRAAPSPGWTLLARLHFYIGLFVGPFILIAAVTGTLFVLTPQIEESLYRTQLRTDNTGPAQPLARQIQAAQSAIGDGPVLAGVRPAPQPGTTTRVMFSEPGQGPSESRAIFVDPHTLDIRGDMIVYGTSGTLPFRTWIDYMHRSLLLGDVGRHYSELAASWLWIATLGGLALWFGRYRNQTPATALNSPRLRLRRRHAVIGAWIAIGVLFLSVTGLTWSKWAGARIGELRQTVGWVTPGINLALTPTAAPAVQDEHAEHHGMHGADHQAHGAAVTHARGAAAFAAPAFAAAVPAASAPAEPAPAAPASPEPAPVSLREHFDPVWQAARAGGIDSPYVEIRPPSKPAQAWSVREYDRSWPTQVDAMAIDTNGYRIVSRADFDSFPLVAKLIRWGIDMHMGILFGWVNQILMAVLGIALSVMIVLGYMMWWKRRPAAAAQPEQTLSAAWLALTWPGRMVTLALAIALGWALPVMGVSLLAFMVVDVLRGWRARNIASAKM